MSPTLKRIVCVFTFCLISFVSVFSQTEIVKSNEKVIINGQKYYVHTVDEGQTIYSISRAYGVKEDDILKANPTLNTYSLKLSEIIKVPIFEDISSDGQYIIYAVKPGDTLYSLSKRYGVTEDEILEENPAVKKKKIKIGDKLRFPIRSIEAKNNILDKDTLNYHYHLVKKGETLYSITKKYNVTKEELVELNENIEGINIKVGDVLQIKKKEFIILDDKSIFLDSIANSVDSIGADLIYDTVDSLKWYSSGSEFEIAILLPFRVDENIHGLHSQEVSKRPQRILSSTKMMISFYAGCLMGFESLISKDVKINLKVYDIGKDNSVLTKLIEEGALSNTDLIFGPAYRAQVDFLNSKINNEKAVLVLPFVNNRDLPKKYKRNVLLQSSEEYILSTVVKIAEKNPLNNYVIINPNDEEERKLVNLYRDSLLRVLSNNNVHIVNFSGVSLDNKVRKVVKKDVENIFIMPFSNEAACTGIFRELFTLRDYQITLIGDVSMINYLSIDPEYYSRIKFSVPWSSKIDRDDSLTQQFITEYRNSFLCEPDVYSYLGYDAISYFVDNLMKYGDNYHNIVIPETEYLGLGGVYRFDRENGYAQSSYSNSVVYLYTLQEDYSFKQVYPDESAEIKLD